MKRKSNMRIATMLVGLGVLVTAVTTNGAQLLYRIAAAQQKTGEISTTVDEGAGGTVVYSKTFYHPGNRTYVTFNAQGDGHEGAGLLMSCRMDGIPCEVGFGAAPPGPPDEWSSLLKLPTAPSINVSGGNCNNGGGGFADCHDNTIHKTWCMHNEPGTHTIELRLATDTAGQQVFYERGTVTIDGSTWDPNIVCANPGT